MGLAATILDSTGIIAHKRRNLQMATTAIQNAQFCHRLAVWPEDKAFLTQGRAGLGQHRASWAVLCSQCHGNHGSSHLSTVSCSLYRSWVLHQKTRVVYEDIVHACQPQLFPYLFILLWVRQLNSNLCLAFATATNAKLIHQIQPFLRK